jgi:hypothetical protein
MVDLKKLVRAEDAAIPTDTHPPQAVVLKNELFYAELFSLLLISLVKENNYPFA